MKKKSAKESKKSIRAATIIISLLAFLLLFEFYRGDKVPQGVDRETDRTMAKEVLKEKEAWNQREFSC